MASTAHTNEINIAKPPIQIPPLARFFAEPATSGDSSFLSLPRLRTPVITPVSPSGPDKSQMQHNILTNDNSNPAPPLEMEMIARVFTGAAGLFGAGDVDKAILLEG